MDAIDPMLAAVAALFVALAALFARERGQLYLTFFQQEEYDAPRFLRWLREQRAYDRVLTWALVAVAIVWVLGWRVGAETPFVLMAVALPLGFWRNRSSATWRVMRHNQPSAAPGSRRRGSAFQARM